MRTLGKSTITTDRYRATTEPDKPLVGPNETNALAEPPAEDTSTLWRIFGDGLLMAVYEEEVPDEDFVYHRVSLIEAPSSCMRERTAIYVERIRAGDFGSVLEAMEAANIIARKRGWKMVGESPAPAP